MYNNVHQVIADKFDVFFQLRVAQIGLLYETECSVKYAIQKTRPTTPKIAFVWFHPYIVLL